MKWRGGRRAGIEDRRGDISVEKLPDVYVNTQGHLAVNSGMGAPKKVGQANSDDYRVLLDRLGATRPSTKKQRSGPPAAKDGY